MRFWSLAAIALVAGISCQKKDTTGEVAPPTIQKVPFVAPADSSVTVPQMKNWLYCNSLLDSLSYLYQDSFKVEDPEKLVKYQTEFVQAQDRLCLVGGLTGGYPEYLWVLRNAGLPRNKAALDSAGMSSL